MVVALNDLYEVDSRCSRKPGVVATVPRECMVPGGKDGAGEECPYSLTREVVNCGAHMAVSGKREWQGCHGIEGIGERCVEDKRGGW